MNLLVKKAQDLALEDSWGNEAIDINKKILALNNKDVGAHNRLAKCFTRRDEYAKAEKMYKQVIEIDPNNKIANNGLRRIHKILDDRDRTVGMTYFDDTFMESSHWELEGIYKDTENHFELGDNKKVIEVGNKLINLVVNMTKSSTINIKNNAVDMIISAHLEHKDAISAIEWVEKLPPSKNITNIKQRLYEIRDSQKGFEIDDIKDVFLLINLGKLHRELKALDKAKLILQRALNLEPNNIYALNAFGSLRRNRNEYEKGINCYENSLKVKKNEAAYVGLGAIYRDIEEFELARENYSLALGMNERSNYAHNGMGAVFVDFGYYAKAERHFLLANDNIGQLQSYANGYINQGKIERAVFCLKCILKKDSKNVEARTKLERVLKDKEEHT